MKKTDLMAPVGDFSMLEEACKAGADSVFFGINEFSMRVGKKNFKISDLDKIRDVCNSYPRKPKMYLTLNTIIYDNEMKKLEDVIDKVKGKIDSIICWDLAVIDVCKKKNVPFIISTQSSIANETAAKFYRELGTKRVVLARELDINQIKRITKIEGLEVEVFVHGAMCVSVSGRCFTSQFLFNKSANRGECAQPCRRSYLIKEKEGLYDLEVYNDKVMSAKDMCTLPFIKELKEAGVTAFKIEGRNRDARYVSNVVKAYRRAIDEDLDAEEVISLMKDLEEVFNRGFSNGFYFGRPLPTDFSTVENSASSIYKDFIGKATHFYPKINVVLVELKKDLKVGDRIVFIHDDMGVEEITLEEMEKEKKNIESAKKGDVIGIKVPKRINKGAEVYKLNKNF